MTTDIVSFRLPTAADLRAIDYSDPHSELLPLILADMREQGWRTPSQLRATTHRSKKVVLEVLNEAHKRQHVTKRHRKDNEHLWTVGEKADAIPSRKPDLLGRDELPTAEDFWANGFTTRPGQYAAAAILALNDNGGELPGAELAAKLRITWHNFGYTLRPLQAIGFTTRIARRGATRENDKIVLVASRVRSMLRAAASVHSRPLPVSRELKTTLDRVDGERVRCWPRLRKTVEVLALHPQYTVEEIAKAIGCDPGGLYGTKKYPGPIKILTHVKILKRSRSRRINRGISLKADRAPWNLDTARIATALPQLALGVRQSTAAVAKRKPRFGQVRREWDQMDGELRRAAEAFDCTKAGIDEETATAYLNIAAVVGRSFNGTYAELATRYQNEQQLVATVAKYARMGRKDGFFTVAMKRNKGGVAGVSIAVNLDAIKKAAGVERASAANGAADATANGPATAEASSSPVPEWSTYEPPGYWEKVFVDTSWKTIRRRIAAGKLRAEQLHKQAWRFAVTDLPANPRKPR